MLYKGPISQCKIIIMLNNTMAMRRNLIILQVAADDINQTPIIYLCPVPGPFCHHDEIPSTGGLVQPHLRLISMMDELRALNIFLRTARLSKYKTRTLPLQASKIQEATSFRPVTKLTEAFH